ncbi:uncharacterized protein PG986_009549 [Apiospora aurea]|uniref:J domain-containing protein n=1 Tax=Apiospora aurea TaxID=335848 RepID=A0ABR1Q7Z4_9PEZI
MPSATASGADAGGANGSAKHREHNQGNQERKYTVEQKAAVLRIRRCQPTAFYDILGIEAVKTTCSEADIKKAYRKQSLLTHPDKNGHEHADEAFKMVSRAFGVLGDKEKREKFDRYGTDPDSRFESARAQAGNPFSGFGGGRAAGGGPGAGFGGGNMWEEEMSPEEMFQRFFGGGFGGPFGGFDTGPQFVFNLGGNRGFRVHQMGGAGPRRRPREAAAGPQRETSGWDTLVSLLPIIFLFLFPLLTSIFSGSETQSAVPKMMFETGEPPYTHHRRTPKYHVDYYINPQDVPGWTDHMFKQLDRQAEVKFTNELRFKCESEMRQRQDLYDNAQGWFYQDPDKMRVARAYEMHSCKRMQKMGLSTR